MATITIFDAKGTAIKSEPTKSTAKRFSVRCAAWQNQLDEMARDLPAAASAKIDAAEFYFDKNRRSQFKPFKN